MSSITLSLALRGRLLSGTQTTFQGALFGNSEPGFSFEPWDITTLYQDRAGTTPVTAAGQSVGLRLDKSKGLALGAELAAPNISNALWVQLLATPLSTVAGDQLTFGGQYSGRRYEVSTTNRNSRYEFRFNARRISGNYNINFFHEGSATGNNTPLTLMDTVSTYVIRPQGASAGGAVSFGFQDRNGSGFGTIEVTNLSVRELSGNHEVAISDAKRGIYGWMPKTGRRNMLASSEDFSAAVWNKVGGTATSNVGVAPDGTVTADRLQFSSAQTPFQSVTFIVGVTYTWSAYVKSNTGSSQDFRLGKYDGANTASANQSATTSWQRFSYTFTAAGTTSPSVYFQTGTGGTACDLQVWGAQLELGSTATAYQRVVSNYDVTEAGVPSCYYVQADGVDDAYVTPTITPNTDKVQVFAGVRKLSDAAVASIVEYSTDANANNGAFELRAPSGALNDVYFRVRGSVAVSGSAVAAAPTTGTVSLIDDISADSAVLRVNGTQAAQSTADQGTGNFLAYPAYIYARGGTSLPFNGLDFGHAVRFGPNLDAATIARVEALIARNTPEVTL